MDDLEKIIEINHNPNSDEIFSHLKFISNLLKDNGIKHWILYGTLLGAIREKNIIKYDYDFDLGDFYEDAERILKLNENINSLGYVLEKGFGVVYNTKKLKESEYKWRVSIKLKHLDKIIGDLYIYYKCNDGFVRRFDPEEKIYYWPNSTFPYYFVEKLEELEINGIKFPAPQHGIELIKHYYGPLWEVPIKAASQDGQNHPDYDLYGNYKYSSLKSLINYVNKISDVELEPSFSKNNIEYLFPLDQLGYIKENENILIKYKK